MRKFIDIISESTEAFAHHQRRGTSEIPRFHFERWEKGADRPKPKGAFANLKTKALGDKVLKQRSALLDAVFYPSDADLNRVLGRYEPYGHGYVWTGDYHGTPFFYYEEETYTADGSRKKLFVPADFNDWQGLMLHLGKLFSPLSESRLDELSIGDFQGGGDDGNDGGHDVVATNIQWDTDGEEVNLPTEQTMRVHGDYNDLSEEIGDMLSDHFGYCVTHFNWRHI